ncbi:polynucleotide adenylyltransferase [Coemansia sp. RSA 552]|nr:polynucleotide adenylyltransferase [Coemansia sp. RSA 552]
MSKPKYLGVTPPVDTSPSTADEEALANDLLATLQSEGQFESEDERKNREVVLGKVDKLVKEFVYRAALKQKRPESLARTYGGKIFTFGSYRLGVHGAGADLDTLCVVPMHVKREDFFEIMAGMLKERSEVTELTPVPDTHVPVIKMVFGGVDMDLTIAVMQQPTVPEDQELADNNLLRTMDEFSVRSLNGSRVTDEILRLVPNVATFRLALRCIKLWAKRRAIYSNSMGFFGGVAWAMVVARICQLYPNKCASTIVTRFFHVLSRWRWTTPVLLKEIEAGTAQFRVWNPRLYASDRAHKMPIITPAYPSMCATHNVSQSTKQIIELEIKRGLMVLDRVMRRETGWQDLFEKDEFFRKYRFYLQVNVSSTNDESNHHLHGYVESRLRQYVARLETTGLFVLIHPYIKSFDHDFACTSDEEVERIRAGFLPDPQQASSPVPNDGAATDSATADSAAEAMVPDTSSDAAEGAAEESSAAPSDGDSGKGKIYTSAFYLGLLLVERDKSAGGSKRRMDLSLPTQEFIRIIKESTVWNSEEMAISIRFLRQEQLPDEVFGGLPRERLHFSSSSSSSSKAKKKKKKRAQAKSAQKDDSEEDAASTEKQAKKAKIAAEAPVPSTSGFTSAPADVQPADKDDASEPKDGGDASSGSAASNGEPRAQPSIPAPVPVPTKTGGIKIKLLGSV